MAEDSENVEVCFSCDDSLYDECYLSVSDREEDIHGGSVGEEDDVSSRDVLGMAPIQLGTLVTR